MLLQFDLYHVILLHDIKTWCLLYTFEDVLSILCSLFSLIKLLKTINIHIYLLYKSGLPQSRIKKDISQEKKRGFQKKSN